MFGTLLSCPWCAPDAPLVLAVTDAVILKELTYQEAWEMVRSDLFSTLNRSLEYSLLSVGFLSWVDSLLQSPNIVLSFFVVRLFIEAVAQGIHSQS